MSVQIVPDRARQITAVLALYCTDLCIDLAGESKESLYGRETDRDLRNANLRSA